MMLPAISSQFGFINLIFNWIMKLIENIIGIAVHFVMILLFSIDLIIPYIAITLRIIGSILYSILMVLFLLLDFLEIFFNRIVGISGTMELVKGSGNIIDPAQGEDLVLTFIQTPEVQDIFWALAIVALVLLIISTGIAILRTEYNEKGENSKGPIIGRAIRAFALFFTIPIACTFGIMGSNYLLRAVYHATKKNNDSSIAGMLFGAVATQSFRFSRDTGAALAWSYSSIMNFNGAFNDADAFYDSIADSSATNFGLLNSRNTADGINQEKAKRLSKKVTSFFETKSEWPRGTESMKQSIQVSTLSIGGGLAAGTAIKAEASARALAAKVYMPHPAEDNWFSFMIPNTLIANATVNQGLVGVYPIINGEVATGFSIYNLGMVWFFYDTIIFDYLTAIIVGMMMLKALAGMCVGVGIRLYELVTLFAISPPIVALMPLDEGAAFKNWSKAFIGRVLGLYGGVVAMNMFFMITPIVKDINFFPTTDDLPIQHPYFIAALNYLPQLIMITAGAISLESIAKMISGLIGAEDTLSAGSSKLKEVASTIGAAASMAMPAAKAAAGAGKFMGKLGGKTAAGIFNGAKGNKVPGTTAREKTKEGDSGAPAQATDNNSQNNSQVGASTMENPTQTGEPKGSGGGTPSKTEAQLQGSIGGYTAALNRAQKSGDPNAIKQATAKRDAAVGALAAHKAGLGGGGGGGAAPNAGAGAATGGGEAGTAPKTDAAAGKGPGRLDNALNKSADNINTLKGIVNSGGESFKGELRKAQIKGGLLGGLASLGSGIKEGVNSVKSNFTDPEKRKKLGENVRKNLDQMKNAFGKMYDSGERAAGRYGGPSAEEAFFKNSRRGGGQQSESENEKAARLARDAEAAKNAQKNK